MNKEQLKYAIKKLLDGELTARENLDVISDLLEEALEYFKNHD